MAHKPVLAALVSIGDEILNGTTINTNASWISTQLQPLGINIHEVIAISDNAQHITSCLESYLNRVQLIVITGGLGPTKDDITKKTLCTLFDSELIFDQDIYNRLKETFEKRNIPFTENNRDQAMYPNNCRVLPNALGTAQGMWFERNGTIVVSLPGVPFEMKGLMTDQVIPLIKQTFTLPVILNRYFMTSGISESYLARQLESVEDKLPDYIGLAYLPSPAVVKLRLTAQGRPVSEMEEMLNRLSAEVSDILGSGIYAFEPVLLEEHIGKLLIESGKTLSIAESCTGGKLSHKITSVPGSSAYFPGSIVTYSYAIKTSHLQVPEAVLQTYGAVSHETIEYMLDGALRQFGSDYAIAISGIAGPDGGTPEKPVGTVWIGVAGKGERFIKKHFFNKNREINIEYACIFALHELRLLLSKHLAKPAQ